MTHSVLSSRLTQVPILPALRNLQKAYASAEVYVVGGAIRDALLKRKGGDIDYLIRNVSYANLARHLQKSGSAQLVGKHFGVIKYSPRGTKEIYDIALPRLEHSLHMSGAYHDFAVQSDPKLPVAEDLKRRDFTINAMAWNIHSGEFVDPSNGLADLVAKKIRTVGNPKQRFQEDYTRLLRALRFAVELDFQIEDSSWRILKQLIGNLSNRVLPREAIAAELVKMFARAPLATVDALENSGALRVLMPEAHEMKRVVQPVLHHREGSVWQHAHLSLEAYTHPEFRRRFPKFKPDAELYFATWMHDIAKSVTMKHVGSHSTKPHYKNHASVGAHMAVRIAERLKLSSAGGQILPRRLDWLLRNHLVRLKVHELDLDEVEHLFCNPNLPGEKLLALNFADAWASIPEEGGHDLRDLDALMKKIALVKKRGFKKGKPYHLLSGKDVMKGMQVSAGPQVGSFLSLVRYQQLEGKLLSKAAALKYLAQYYQSKLKKSS
ncbi:MAG: hypothetical protein H6760_04530 [Candidatus Nomurabacteria bacterium]|nr:MAG: hypothetical protein H6760_04530 [Candidatus Nomurabacteria bacterium]